MFLRFTTMALVAIAVTAVVAVELAAFAVSLLFSVVEFTAMALVASFVVCCIAAYC